MRNHVAILVAVAVLAAAGGYFAAMTLDRPGDAAVPEASPSGTLKSVPSPDDLVGRRRPEFKLADGNGNWVSVSDFDGQVVLVNFWATWCKPCVEEMPMLSRLQGEFADRGLQVLGIALDEAERAQEFAESLEVSYPVLFGQTDVVLTGRHYGNGTGMLPYSVLIDRRGLISWAHLGVLAPDETEHRIEELLSR